MKALKALTIPQLQEGTGKLKNAADFWFPYFSFSILFSRTEIGTEDDKPSNLLQCQ